MSSAVVQRFHVVTAGQGQQPMVFAHGFGCDQQMWRFVAPAFETTHRTVLFDHVGCGRSDLSAYEPDRHARIEGYAQDVLAILEDQDLRDVVFVGHSVSAMIGVLAAIRAPERFAQLVLIGPSPRYLNDPDTGYVGGFERADLDGLLDLMESNVLGWANFLAPAVTGEALDAASSQELRASFCAADPWIARRFAEATFLGDNRADLPRLTVPALILQCEDDAIAPPAVGDYLQRHLPGSRLEVLPVSGHCPHLTHPALTIEAIRRGLAPR